MTKEIELTDSERQPCECWTRVMGYFRPVSEFNQGKKAEFKERKYFSEAKIPQSIQGIAQYHKKIKNYLRRHNIAGDFLGISIGLERKNYKFVLVGKSPKTTFTATAIQKKNA